MLNYEQIDYDKILNYFNVQRVKHYGDQIQFSCPFPEHYRGDRNPSAGIHTKSGKWNCFSCGRKGSIETFIADLEGIPVAVATRWLREGFSTGFIDGVSCRGLLKKATRKKPQKTEVTLPSEAVDLFYVDWDKAYGAYNNKDLPRRLSYIFDRGFLPSTLKESKIGYDPHSRRITIPLFSSEGNLLGFKGRATSPNESPKYLGIGDREYTYYGFPTCKTSDFVFGIQTINPSDEYVIICEGEFDALMLRQNGFDTAIALGGSNLSEKQIKSLKRNCSKAILLLDPDKAGAKAEKKLTEALLKFMPLYIAKVPAGFDPAKMSKEQVEKAINQATNALTHRS
jgi:DNA primase